MFPVTFGVDETSQVVITGDFFQLPPVSKGNRPIRYAFEAVAWTQTIKRAIRLTKVFRQKDEGEHPSLYGLTSWLKECRVRRYAQ